MTKWGGGKVNVRHLFDGGNNCQLVSGIELNRGASLILAAGGDRFVTVQDILSCGGVLLLTNDGAIYTAP